MMNKTLSILLLTFTASVWADSATDIINRHQTALLTDLQAYVAANPGADDLEDAQNASLNAAITIGDTDTALNLLETQATAEGAAIMTMARNLSYFTQLAQEAGAKDRLEGILTKIGPKLKEVQNPQIQQVVAQAEAALKKAWPGGPMTLEGTTTDGKAFSLAALKGKVVLVDFWATWCGPCRAEYPNILANYEKYHDKGFEVVGVSGDQQKRALTDYLTEKKVPWPNLFDSEQKESLIEQHGVTAFPTMYLINREGNIVSTTARGPALDAALAKLFSE